MLKEEPQHNAGGPDHKYSADSYKSPLFYYKNAPYLISDTGRLSYIIDFFQFKIKCFCINHCRFILKWHIYDSCVTTKCCRCSSMLIIFTPLISWVVQMCMRIDCTWENIISFCINNLCCFWLFSCI